MLETLKSAEVAFDALLHEAMQKFGNYENAYPEVTHFYESRELTTNLMQVIGEPVVRKLKKGEDRPVDHFDAVNYPVGVDDYAVTAGCPIKYLEYDRLGVMRDKIQRIPQAIKRHYAKLAWDALLAGFTTNCWDGQYFFDTDHPYFIDENLGTTFSNKFTEDLSQPAFEAALERLQSIGRAEDDDPLNPCEDLLLVVGPQNRALAHEIVAPSIGKFNRNAEAAKVLVVGALKRSPRTWYLWDRSLDLKPLFLKVNKRMDDLVSLDQPRDPNVFHQAEALYGARGEHKIAYLHPYNIVGSKPA